MDTQLGPPRRGPAAGALDHLIADLADHQHGVVSRDQLRALGLTDTMIAWRVRTGHLHRIGRNVCAVGHRTLDVHARRIRAIRTFTTDVWLSHRSAGAAWNMAWDATRTTHVSVMHRRGLAARDGITLHRPRTLRPEDVTDHDGLPVTTPARTIFDLAATEPERIVERAIEDAEIDRLFGMRRITELADRRVPGTRAVLRVLEIVDPDQQTAMRSKLEEAFFVMSRRHAIERPRVNAHVGEWRVDVHWPDRRVVVELDSAGFHLNRIAFERDRRQDADLQLAGWLVLRFTYRRVAREPGEVLAAVERALAPANMGRAA